MHTCIHVDSSFYNGDNHQHIRIDCYCYHRHFILGVLWGLGMYKVLLSTHIARYLL